MIENNKLFPWILLWNLDPKQVLFTTDDLI